MTGVGHDRVRSTEWAARPPARLAGGLELLFALVTAPAGARPATVMLSLAEGAASHPLQWPDARGAAGTSGEPNAGLDAEQVRVVALVDLARGGDTDAFADLYDRYVGVVYRYVFHRVGSHSLAEDLTSETFLRALRAIRGFSWQGRDIGAWFTTIARNLITDHVKSSRFRLEVTTADLLDMDRGTAGPEDDVLSRLEAERLMAAVRSLAPQQQECIALRFLHGFSVAETARVLGRSEGAVKQLQLRAVRTLARLLSTDDARSRGSGG